jgi:nucleotide-binding universal stress UspA family protein
MRILVCADGASIGWLLDRAVDYVRQPVDWLVVHVVDTRGRVDLGLLRAGVPGAPPLAAGQRASIIAAAQEHARAVRDDIERALGERSLVSTGVFDRIGEPGREICSVARVERADLVVLRAKRRPGPPSGPPSVGHTARFVVDHAPCPVLLLRDASA